MTHSDSWNNRRNHGPNVGSPSYVPESYGPLKITTIRYSLSG